MVRFLPMMERAWGTPSPAAPSCRRADATLLEALPERIGELSKLKNLCVAARRVHLIAPCHGAAQVHRPVQPNEAPRFDLRPHNLEPVRAALRCPLASASNPAARPHRRDVSNNALKELPECVCNMGNLTSLYAPS